MKKSEALKKRIARYLRKEQLFKSDENKKLEKSFLTKHKRAECWQ